MLPTTSIVIVYGPMASGKTSNAGRLLNYFGCTRLVDDWNGRTPLQAGDLALTTLEPPFRVKAAHVFDVHTALARLAIAFNRVR